MRRCNIRSLSMLVVLTYLVPKAHGGINKAVQEQDPRFVSDLYWYLAHPTSTPDVTT